MREELEIKYDKAISEMQGYIELASMLDMESEKCDQMLRKAVKILKKINDDEELIDALYKDAIEKGYSL